ncbi:MAG: tetratricopeptide repeat-containing sulfotransferase family protein [Gammaproteobacteria bacterium]
MKNKTSNRAKSLATSGYTPAERIIALFQQAESAFGAENYPLARELLTNIVDEDKRFYPALRQRGIAELRVGDITSSIDDLSRYVKFEPGDALARANLAQAYLAAGQLPRARQQINKTLSLNKTPDFYFLAAAIEEAMGEPGQAAKHYAKGLNLDTERHSAKLALAAAYKDNEQYHKAQQVLLNFLAEDSDNANALTNLGNLYHRVGAFELAVDCFERALTRTAQADFFYNLGLSQLQLRNTDKSIEAFNNALALEPDHINAKIQLAETMSSLGDFSQALSLLDEVAADQDASCQAIYLKSQIQNFHNQTDDLAVSITKQIKSEKNHHNVALLNFALTKIYDDTNRYDLAFKSAMEANRIKFKSRKKAAAEYINDLEKAAIDINWNTPGILSDSEDTPSPIFIIGMPRSGTTLLERHICSAESIISCGELDYLNAALYRRAQGLAEFRGKEQDHELSSEDLQQLKKGYLDRAYRGRNRSTYFVDKTPDNFKYFDLINTMFSEARFIHCRRNPLDTSLSIYFQLFEGLPYSYDLRCIAKTYLKSIAIIERQKCRAPHKWLVVDYEDLVLEPTATSARLANFLGVELSSVTETAKNSDSPINTMSKWQARQAIYKGSINRWKHYEKQLAGLKNDLRSILDPQV